MSTNSDTERRRDVGSPLGTLLHSIKAGIFALRNSHTYEPVNIDDQEDMTNSSKPFEEQEVVKASSSSVAQSPTKDNEVNQAHTAPSEVKESPQRSWRSYLWDTFDKSPEERRFLFKLDIVLMTLASLGYFIKYQV